MATIPNPGAQTALSGYPKQVVITGELAGQPPITWSLDTPPAGVTIAPATDTTALLTINRECTTNAPLVLSVTILADEDGEVQASRTITVTVSPRPTSPAVLAAAGAL